MDLGKHDESKSLTKKHLIVENLLLEIFGPVWSFKVK